MSEEVLRQRKVVDYGLCLWDVVFEVIIVVIVSCAALISHPFL